MKWSDTEASQCRYGDIAGRIFGNAEILWENSSADYQGHANVLALLDNNILCHYEWTYGSCGGCDTWESLELSSDQIEVEMRRDAVYIEGLQNIVNYLKHVTQDYESIEEGLRQHYGKD